MDIGVIVPVKVTNAIDNCIGLLATGGVVEINQRLIADFFLQDWEVCTDFIYWECCHTV
jgi:hypothetical protein